MRISAQLERDSNDRVGIDRTIENSTPTQQASLRSMMDLSRGIAFDLWVYHVSELKRTSFSVGLPVSEYTSLNARLAWQARKDLELSLVGQNLLDDSHLEFVGENILIQTEVERSVYAKVRLDF
jgi:iron complex outermembrane receptor protein